MKINKDHYLIYKYKVNHGIIYRIKCYIKCLKELFLMIKDLIESLYEGIKEYIMEILLEKVNNISKSELVNKGKKFIKFMNKIKK